MVLAHGFPEIADYGQILHPIWISALHLTLTSERVYITCWGPRRLSERIEFLVSSDRELGYFPS